MLLNNTTEGWFAHIKGGNSFIIRDIRAFQTVNKEILPNKLHRMGFADKVMSRFKSNLQHRLEITNLVPANG